jgi:alginate O-acetyltransferase complex protein AlgJ
VRSFFGFSTNADATVLNGRWTKAVETHYDEFPIKRLGTNLWAALDFKLFNEGRPGVVLGRDQWLYSDEEFNPIVNEELNLQGNYALVEGVRQTLKAKGVQLVMAIVPAKVRLYPEHLGEVKPASIHANLYKDFHARGGRPDPPLTCWARCKAAKRDGSKCSCAPTPTGPRKAPKSPPTSWPRPLPTSSRSAANRSASSPSLRRKSRTRATCVCSCRWTRCSKT